MSETTKVTSSQIASVLEGFDDISSLFISVRLTAKTDSECFSLIDDCFSLPVFVDIRLIDDAIEKRFNQISRNTL